jgi:hypothetical protein
LQFLGEKMGIAQWAKRLGVKPGVISSRIHDGWPIEATLTRPCRKGVSLGPKKSPDGKVVGHYTPIKPTNRQVQHYRSNLELKFMRLLDADPCVLSWSYENIFIEFTRDGVNHRTLPDFIVTLDSGKRFVCEVKGNYYLPRHLQGGRYDVVRSWAHDHGMPYVLWTEDGFMFHERIEAMREEVLRESHDPAAAPAPKA